VQVISRLRAPVWKFLSFSLKPLALFVGVAWMVQPSPAGMSADVGDQPPISVRSNLVVLPVNVTDGQGNFIADLGKDNFRVYEEKRAQTLTLFQQGDSPVSVGLLVDHSGSMEPKLANVVTAVTAFAHSGNPEDEMFVVDFNDSAVVESVGEKPFTSDAVDLEKAITAISARGRTALYDAVAQGLGHLQLAHRQKKALIIISDGGDNGSRYDYAQILAYARESQVVIYSIGLLDESGKEENPKILKQLSKDTGGLSFFPESSESVLKASVRIAKDLREQYVLGFVPEAPSTSSFRKIQVSVIAPQRGALHVRTRPGYYSSPN